MLVGGEWRAGGGGSFATLDPATGATLSHIARGDATDVDLAVASARKALESSPWKAMPPMERAQTLWAVADLMEAHIDQLSELETLDQGKPLFVGRWAEIPGAINQFRYFADQALTIEGQTINSSIGAVSPTATCLRRDAAYPNPRNGYPMTDRHSASAAERRSL